MPLASADELAGIAGSAPKFQLPGDNAQIICLLAELRGIFQQNVLISHQFG